VTYWVNRIMSHGSTCTDPWHINPLPALTCVLFDSCGAQSYSVVLYEVDVM